MIILHQIDHGPYLKPCDPYYSHFLQVHKKKKENDTDRVCNQIIIKPFKINKTDYFI